MAHGTDGFPELFDVPWGEFTLILSDGTNESVLSPPCGSLHENSGTARLLGEFHLRALTGDL